MGRQESPQPLPSDISIEGKISDARTKFRHSQPLEDQAKEAQRRVFKELKEVNKEDPEELKAFAESYWRLLRDPANRPHFVGMPSTLAEFLEELGRPDQHGLGIYNELDEIIGFATIEDARRDEHDHRLSRVVIVNNLQNKRRDGGPRNVGSQALGGILMYTFTNPAYDGRIRESIHTNVVLGLPNSQRMIDLLEHNEFQNVYYGQVEVDVFYNGEYVKRPTSRYKMDRQFWTYKNFFETHNQPPQEPLAN